nr:hypothetical protein [Tanacetum cinerariifolium]
MDKGEGEEDIFSILNNFKLKMSKIADPVGKSGDHIEKTASSNVLSSCSDEIFGGATYGSQHDLHDDFFLFQIENKDAMDKVLEDGPWLICTVPLILNND